MSTKVLIVDFSYSYNALQANSHSWLFSSWSQGLITLKNWFACNRKYVGESWLFAKIICTRPEMVSEQFSWIRGNNFDYCRQSSPYCIWLSSSVRYHQKSKKMPLFKYGGEGWSANISRKKVCSVFGTLAMHFWDLYQLKQMRSQTALVFR